MVTDLAPVDSSPFTGKPGDIEDWFCAALSEKNMPVAHMLTLLRELYVKDPETANEWAGLLGDALAEREECEGTLALGELIAGWRGTSSGAVKEVHTLLARVFRDRAASAILESGGFDKERDSRECVRRMRLLITLKPDVLCFDKTWGVGVVRGCDPFYKRVSIDFHGKPGHHLSYGHAAAQLEILHPEHIRAVMYQDPQVVKDMAADEPAELVRWVLKDCGDMTAERLKAILVDGVLDESSWKGVWDRARKRLKTDPQIVFPQKRSQPIEFHASSDELSNSQLQHLATERDLSAIIKQIVMLLESGKEALLGEAEGRSILQDRLGFVIRGAEGKKPGLVVQAALVAEECGLGAELSTDDVLRTMLDPARFAKASASVPARRLTQVVERLSGQARGALQDAEIAVLDEVPIHVLGEIMDHLLKTGADARCRERVSGLMGALSVPMTVLCWICKQRSVTRDWSEIRTMDLLSRVVDALGASAAGDALKAQHQLRQVFEKPEWIAAEMKALSPGQREDLLVRVRDVRGWETTAQRSAMARMIKLYPDLGALAARTSGRQEEKVVAKFTSWRSYRERQEQFRRLVEETIPQNSRDIAHARSYGDLRENFEYQAAKDQQRLLLQRHAEMERDLAEVKGSGFDGYLHDVAGVGTTVVLERPDGATETFTLLGEWDRDQDLRIISSRSRVAEILEGHRGGDNVALPLGEAGAEVVCRVQAVLGLSEAIQGWITGRAEAEGKQC